MILSWRIGHLLISWYCTLLLTVKEHAGAFETPNLVMSPCRTCRRGRPWPVPTPPLASSLVPRWTQRPTQRCGTRDFYFFKCACARHLMACSSSSSHLRLRAQQQLPTRTTMTSKLQSIQALQMTPQSPIHHFTRGNLSLMPLRLEGRSRRRAHLARPRALLSPDHRCSISATRRLRMLRTSRSRLTDNLTTDKRLLLSKFNDSLGCSLRREDLTRHGRTRSPLRTLITNHSV